MDTIAGAIYRVFMQATYDPIDFSSVQISKKVKRKCMRILLNGNSITPISDHTCRDKIGLPQEAM